MDDRVTKFLAERIANRYERHTQSRYDDRYNRGDDARDAYNREERYEREDMEARRRRRKDGTFMRGEGGSQVEIEYSPENRGYNRTNMHKGPDDEDRRRIGFNQGHSYTKSHWNEEEFVGDMEESLYHEVDDIFHYSEICEKVNEKGYRELAKAFYEIANEKFICAEFLKHHLKKLGVYNPSEHPELEEDLKYAKKMFG